MPVGVVQDPEAVVQNTTVNCLIAVVTVAVKAPSYWTEVWPARESEIVILALVKVPALTLWVKSGARNRFKRVNIRNRTRVDLNDLFNNEILTLLYYIEYFCL